VPEIVNDGAENVNAALTFSAPEPAPQAIFPLMMEHMGIGPGKKELGFVEVITMLQVRYDETPATDLVYPQKGLWIYERDAQMRRHFKREYPEFFAPKRDRQAAHKREEQRAKANRIRGERRSTGKFPAVRSAPIDISAYQRRASS